jgi:hypothetical protein
MSNNRIKETSFENCKVVTCGFSQELHDKVVEMVKDNPFWLADYDLEEVDPEMVNVWITDAYSEGDEDYVNFLRNTIIDDGTLYTLTESVGGLFKQPLGEVAVYIYDEDEEQEELDEKASKVKILKEIVKKSPKKERKPVVRVVSDEKKALFNEISGFLKRVYGINTEILTENKLISVRIGDKTFKIDVIEQRKPKK